MNRKEHVMAYGDRIYARLCLNGRKIVEFMIEKVASMTELLGELRSHAREARGLCRLYVRNMSRGWSMERPLMLYPERYPTSGGWRERAFRTPESEEQPRRMLMPWETH